MIMLASCLFIVLFAALSAVNASDRRGISAHGGYYDEHNRWISSYRTDIDGNPVEGPLSVWDDNWGQSFIDSLHSVPSPQEYAALCQQAESMRLNQGAPRPRGGMMRPPAGPRIGSGEGGMRRGRAPLPARGGRQQGRGRVPVMPRPMGMPPMNMNDEEAPMPRSGRRPIPNRYDEYGEPRRASRPPSDYESPSDHDADLIPRRRRGVLAPNAQGQRQPPPSRGQESPRFEDEFGAYPEKPRRISKGSSSSGSRKG